MAFRPRTTIPTRIFIAFASVLIAFGLIAAMSVLQHARTAQTLKLLQEGYLPLALSVGEAKSTHALMATQLGLGPGPGALPQRWLKAFQQVRPSTQRRLVFRLEKAQRLAMDHDDHAFLRALEGELAALSGEYEATRQPYADLFDAIERGDPIATQKILAALQRRETQIQSHYRTAWRDLQERVAITSARAAESERQATVLLAILALIGLAVGLLAAWGSQRLLRPLPELHARVQAVSRGDLSTRLQPRRDDELGRLTQAFEEMVASLNESAEAERRLQRMQEQIVANLRAAVVVVDSEWIVRTANPAASQVLGVRREDEGKPLQSTELLERMPELRASIEEVFAGADRATLRAAPIDTVRRVHALVTPFGDAEERSRRSALVVAEDVTEELATEARLLQTERLAAIGRMAAHVTHEVRNPLSSIGLNVEMLEDELGSNSGEARQLMRAIQKEIDRLAGITGEYLRLARLPQPNLVADDLHELLTSLSSFVGREMEAAGIHLRLSLPPTLPEVAIDEPQLRQAFLNLLRNARESMPAGGTIDLRARLHAGGVEVVVTDEGPGIPAEERERIFDLFYTTKSWGTGLGLPLTQQIIVAHGGEIRCEAQEERGTRFVLWLPAPAKMNRAAIDDAERPTPDEINDEGGANAEGGANDEGGASAEGETRRAG